MSCPLKPPPIWLSSNDVCSEEDFLKWLMSYRHTDSVRIRKNPELNLALGSKFPEGRYNEGLMVFLSAFRGLLPGTARSTQRDFIQSTHLLVQQID